MRDPAAESCAHPHAAEAHVVAARCLDHHAGPPPDGHALSCSPIGLRDRAILELLYGAGLRLGEAARTDITDLDLRSGLLLVRNGKGRKDRIVPICGAAAVALDTYLSASRPALATGLDAALFLSRDGARLGAAGLRARIQYYGRRISVRLTPHALRHACATHLLRGGADLRHVQALLGHRHLTTTALYTRVRDHRSACGPGALSPKNARASPACPTVESIVLAAQPTTTST